MEAVIYRAAWRRPIVAAVAIGGALLSLHLLALARSPYTASAPTPSPARQGALSAAELYAQVSGLRHEVLPDRVKAARALAKHPQGEPWMVLLFISSQMPPTGDQEERARQAGLHPFVLGLVAVAVDALPEKTPPSVLLALTYLLNETERGLWSEVSGILVKRRSEHHSQPIRELVRNRLKTCLGVDEEWDPKAWRVAIIKRANVSSEQPRTHPTSKATGGDGPGTPGVR